MPLPPILSNNEKIGYGPIHFQRKAFLFDKFNFTSSTNVFESENPMSMESVGPHFCVRDEREHWNIDDLLRILVTLLSASATEDMFSTSLLKFYARRQVE